MLGLIEWLWIGEYLSGDIPGARDFAARALDKLRKRIKKGGQDKVLDTKRFWR